ncbi:aprataxin-like protein [Tilletia horrida]|nr:aprataxin-like protein [Tilletia horrida]
MSPLGAGGAGGAGWANALTQIAKTKDPVPGNVPDGTRLVDHDSHTITIEDKWPKSTFHHLVLPSEASKGKEGVDASTAPPKLGLAGGRLSGGTSASGNTVPASHLQSLSTLLASPYAAQVLAAMRTASDRAVEQIHSLMRAYVAPGSKGKQKCQVTWSIERAFHAIPSMQTVHLQ